MVPLCGSNDMLNSFSYRQKGTPWADGVSGLSQWAIKPGRAYRYKWKATERGTYWYHSHDKDRIMDGLYGAIQIR
jgi:FtsP/CotA-like multicopper oxidase with cupredoxin domain